MTPSSHPRVRLVLPPERVGRELTAIGRVRRAALDFLHRNGVTDGVYEVMLVLSELVTNVIVHTDHAPGVAVELEPEGKAVVVEVSDLSSSEPAVRDPDRQREGGRGLMIVERVATSWGVRIGRRGKTTWAEVPVAPVSLPDHGTAMA